MNSTGTPGPGAVEDVLARLPAPLQGRGRTAGEDGERLLPERGLGPADRELEVAHDGEALGAERTGHDRLLSEEQAEVQTIGVGNRLRDLGGDQGRGLGRDVLQAGDDLDVAHVVVGRRRPDLARALVEDADGRRARGEVDVVAGQLVGRVSEGVEEAHHGGRRPQGTVDESGGEQHSIAALVDPGAVGREERHRLVVVDLDTHGGEQVAGLVEDAVDEGVVEEAQAWLHGHLGGRPVRRRRCRNRSIDAFAATGPPRPSGWHPMTRRFGREQISLFRAFGS